MSEAVVAEVIEPVNLAKVPDALIEYTLPRAEVKNVSEIDAFVSSIESFFADVKIDVTNQEQVKELKRLRADVNKVAEAIDTKRKDMDRAVKSAMSEADGVLNTLRDRVKAVYKKTGEQIDEAERLRIENRKSLLAQEYEGIAPDLMEIIPLESFLAYEKRFLLKTWGDLKACNELDELVEKVVAERKTLAGLVQFANEADMVYCKTLDAAAALAENTRLIEAKRAAEKHKVEAEKLAALIESRQAEPEDQAIKMPEPESHGLYRIEFHASKHDLALIKQYLKSLPSFSCSSFKVVA